MRILQGLGLCEEDIKTLFGHFDIDGSGEIDFSEFRRFLLGGIEETGLQVSNSRSTLACLFLTATAKHCLTCEQQSHTRGRSKQRAQIVLEK